MTNVPIRPHGGLRGLDYVSRSSTEDTRFGRMFRWLPGESYARADLGKLAASMIQGDEVKDTPPFFPGTGVAEGPSVTFKDTPPLLDTQFGEAEADDENPTVPAGYTYFGQFIDHDLTFDPNSSLQKLNDPDATENFRTPRLDLDSLYGRGPDDQPYLYDDGAKAIRFILDGTRPGELQRNRQQRALIGDPRNDENHIVSQLQAVFLNFHNKVIDQLGTDRPDLALRPHEKFELAQRIVRWHYQYLVINDYLPKIVGHKTWTKVLGPNPGSAPVPHLAVYKPKAGKAYIPVEFSVAAFRFGHSMVRPSYALNDKIGGAHSLKKFSHDRFNRVPIFDGETDASESLDGFQALPELWEIDWRMFFSPLGALPVKPEPGGATWQVDYAGHPDLLTQPSYRIDTKLVDPLAMLPVNVAKSGDQPDNIPVLAYRNLLRGSQFQLPSGQNVARALGVAVLDDNKLWGGNAELQAAFAFNAPLWYYILKESELLSRVPSHPPLPNTADELGGHFLGPVGGQIVAEVIVGVLWHDHTSYLYQDSHWQPGKEKQKSGFKPAVALDTIHGLISWVTGGTMQF